MPLYVVFADAGLIQMAQDKPQNEYELLAVSGVGQHKLEKCGDAFLNMIVEYGESQSAAS